MCLSIQRSVRFAYLSLSLLILLGFAPLSMAQEGDQEVASEQSSVTRQGDMTISQLITPQDAWNELPLERKQFAYEIAQAIDAGRDIIWLQKSPDGLKIRKLLESIWKYKRLFKPADRASLEEYLARLYLHHANYSERSGKKFVPDTLTYDRLVEMIKVALSASEEDEKNRLHSDLLRRAEKLSRAIFDANYRPDFKTDDLREGAPRFYTNIDNPEELKRAEEAFKAANGQGTSNPFLLTYPTKINGKIEFKLAKINGRFDQQLRPVYDALGRASQFGNAQEKAIIAALQKTMITGDFKDALAADRLWVQHQSPDIDFVIGFVETYLDPRDVRGSWEGFITLKKIDPDTVARVKATRDNATYFESTMPVRDGFKKTGSFTPPQAEAAFLVYSGGDNGESPFVGVNLPNDSEIRETLGSKSSTAWNVMTNLKNGKPVEPEYGKQKSYYTPRGFELLQRVDAGLFHDIQVEFHEILGHGSGKLEAGASENDLGNYYSPIEEGRAELASLYHLMDPKLQEFGILPKDWTETQVKEFVEFAIIEFFTGHLRSYKSLADSTTEIRQAHQWARQAMMGYLINFDAIKIVVGDSGIPLVEVIDLDKVRSVLGSMWGEIQYLKSTGRDTDKKEENALAFLRKYGGYEDLHREWRMAIVKQSEKLNSPKERMMLNPIMRVVKDGDTVTDVKLEFETLDRGLGGMIDRQVAASKKAKQACQASLGD